MNSVVEKFELNPAKLCGPTTNDSTSITGRTNRFTQKLMDAIGAQDVVVRHSIIHQENLCTKVLAFAEVMKDIVQCVNYVIGLNYRQFKASYRNTWTVIILMLCISLLYVCSVEQPP